MASERARKTRTSGTLSKAAWDGGDAAPPPSSTSRRATPRTRPQSAPRAPASRTTTPRTARPTGRAGGSGGGGGGGGGGLAGVPKGDESLAGSARVKDWPGARRRPSSARARPLAPEFSGSLEGVPQPVHTPAPPPPHLDLSEVKRGAASASPGHAEVAAPSSPLSLAPESGGAEVTAVHLANLEEEFRAVLGRLRSVYEGEKEILVRAFRGVDDGNGAVEVPEFMLVWRQLGVDVSFSEASALFLKYGYRDTMPYEKFAYILLVSPTRRLATESRVRKGAFVAGKPANFFGKIIYPQCRKPVYPPSDWDPEFAERSARAPDADLDLRFVYGYNGLHNTTQNLFYNALGDAVYYTAGVGVVYSRPPAHSQRFFRGHSDDIKCLALLEGAAVTFRGEAYPARTLAATGQVCTPTEDPFVSVWDTRCASGDPKQELTRLHVGRHARGIIAVGFSADGTKLACVGSDNQHTVFVFDWRSGKLEGEGKGFTGEPPQVFGLVWNPFGGSAAPGTGAVCPEEFVTFGKKHCKTWSRLDSGQWKANLMQFGKHEIQNVVSACYLPPSEAAGGVAQVVTGVASGELFLWRHNVAIRAIRAHKPGPLVTQPDGTRTHGGARGLKLRADGRVLASGGADGTLRFWDVSGGDLKMGKQAQDPVKLEISYTGDTVPAVRALDLDPDGARIVVGTNRCDIMEVSTDSGEQETYVTGHTADLYCVAWHPKRAHVFASSSESSRVFLWDASDRSMLRTCRVGFGGRQCAFSAEAFPLEGDGPGNDSHHLAVGGRQGRLKVLDELTLRPVWEAHDCTQAISDLKYSPNNRYLAVASHDAYIDVYNASRGYEHVSRCTGHSATVKHLDWRLDSKLLQANCAAYEVLYWDPKTGRQITANQRNAGWHTWTCALGFPVMGIWPDDSDGTDVNSVARSHCGRYVATADDSGYLTLLNFPCVVEDAPGRVNGGHSSHVMCVRWSADDRFVMTAGGRDRALFMWRKREMEPEPEAPPESQRVWGQLDASGKTFGWTREDKLQKIQAGGTGGVPPRPPLPAAAAGGARTLQEEAAVEPGQRLEPETAGYESAPEEEPLESSSVLVEDDGPRSARPDEKEGGPAPSGLPVHDAVMHPLEAEPGTSLPVEEAQCESEALAAASVHALMRPLPAALDDDAAEAAAATGTEPTSPEPKSRAFRAPVAALSPEPRPSPAAAPEPASQYPDENAGAPPPEAAPRPGPESGDESEPKSPKIVPQPELEAGGGPALPLGRTPEAAADSEPAGGDGFPGALGPEDSAEAYGDFDGYVSDDSMEGDEDPYAGWAV